MLRFGNDPCGMEMHWRMKQKEKEKKGFTFNSVIHVFMFLVFTLIFLTKC